MDTFEARRLFLKLGGFALAAAAGLKGSIHSQAYERGYLTNADAEDYGRAYDLGYGNPVVEEFAPEKPFRYNANLFTDKLGLFPGWEKQLGPTNYFNYHKIDPTPEDPWYQMRMSKLRHKRDIAQVMCHTQPLFFPDIEGDSKIQEISGIKDPLKRMEKVLTALGIETREQCDPKIIESDWMVDSQTYYVGEKLIYYAELFRKAMSLINRYDNTDEGLSPEAEEHKAQLYFAALDISKNYLDGYAEEFVARTCNTYFIFDPKMWPEHPLKMSLETIFDGSCHRMASIVMHTLAFLSGKPEDSPIFPQQNGLVGIKEVGKLTNGDSNWSIDNLALWFKTESNKHGWEDVTGNTYEELLTMTSDGSFIVSIAMTDERLVEPKHLSLLWQNRGCNNQLMWAVDMNSTPNSYIYMPVSATENVAIYGYPTKVELTKEEMKSSLYSVTEGKKVDPHNYQNNYVKMYRHKIC